MSKDIHQPPRPSLPLALYLFATAFVVVRIALSPLGEGSFGVGLCIAAAVLSLSTYVFFLIDKKYDVCALILALSLCSVTFLMVSHTFVVNQKNGSEALTQSPVSTWLFTVIEPSRKKSYGYSTVVLAHDDSSGPFRVLLQSKEAFKEGDEVRCVGTFTSADTIRTSTEAMSYCGVVRVRYVLTTLESKGIRQALEWIKNFLTSCCMSKMTKERALFCALVLGDTSYAKKVGLSTLLTRCGVAHFIAVSGMHISLMCGLIDALLNSLGLKASIRALVAALVIGSFVAFCGAPVSAIRAWLMSVLSFGSSAFGRRKDALSALGFACLLMIFLNPTVVYNVSFLLSLSCVLGLLIFGSYANYIIRLLIGTLPRLSILPWKLKVRADSGVMSVASIISATHVCMCATLPISASSFSLISLVAPLSAIFVSLFAPILVTLAFIVAICCFVPPTAQLAFAIWDSASQLFLGCLGLCSDLPMASIPLATNPALSAMAVIVFAVILYVSWPQLTRIKAAVPTGIMCVLLFSYLVFCRYFKNDALRMLSIGQGDAILLESQSASILIDTGPDNSILEALGRAHVVHLDAVILTHLHDDHKGGLEAVLSYVDVDKLLVCNGSSQVLTDELASYVRTPKVEELFFGDVLSCNSFELELVSPKCASDGSLNEDSLVFKGSLNKGTKSLTFLLTGDAESDVLSQLIEEHCIDHIDVLKVGHHGSEASITKEQAYYLSPSVALISAGKNNKFSHPRKECVEALKACGASIFVTKDQGDITLSYENGLIELTCTKAK